MKYEGETSSQSSAKSSTIRRSLPILCGLFFEDVETIVLQKESNDDDENPQRCEQKNKNTSIRYTTDHAIRKLLTFEEIRESVEISCLGSVKYVSCAPIGAVVSLKQLLSEEKEAIFQGPTT